MNHTCLCLGLPISRQPLFDENTFAVSCMEQEKLFDARVKRYLDPVITMQIVMIIPQSLTEEEQAHPV